MAETIRNDEWELTEMIEHLSADLDEVTDTLALRTRRRDSTYSPASVSLELNVSSRYDAAARKVLFRSGQPGEEGLSKLRLELAPAVSEHFQTQTTDHGRPRDERLIDAAMLLFLGIADLGILSKLWRLGIRSIGDLVDAVRTEAERKVVAAKSGLRLDAIAALLRPFIESVTRDDGDWVIRGYRFGNARGTVIGDDTKPLLLVSWTDDTARVRRPERAPKTISIVTAELLRSDPYAIR